MGKGCYLTTTELHRLDVAVAPLAAIDPHGLYLVGSAGERPDFRDVDVRLILSDDGFDRLFGHSPELWSVFCYAVSRWLSADTDMPVPTPGQDLEAFLLQRISEDEAGALGPWTDREKLAQRYANEPRGHVDEHGWFTLNPAAMVAECAAKRRMVELHGRWSLWCAWSQDADAVHDRLCDTLLALAQPYVDHPDFDASWRLS